MPFSPQELIILTSFCQLLTTALQRKGYCVLLHVTLSVSLRRPERVWLQCVLQSDKLLSETILRTFFGRCGLFNMRKLADKNEDEIILQVVCDKRI